MLAVAAMACSKDDPVSIAPEQRFTISPLFIGVDPGESVQLQATIGGNPAQVTYESSDQSVATVSATGLVTTLKAGFAAVAARQVADPSQVVTSNINVLAPQGTTLANNVGLTVASSGARFTTKI
jgi:uncharacterized protein YjdB